MSRLVPPRRLALVPALIVAGLLLSIPAPAQPPAITGPVLLPGEGEIVASAGRDETPTLVRGQDLVLAVWADSRTNFFSPPPFSEEQGGRDIYAARLDASGNLIDEIPIAVNQDFGYQKLPRAAWNGENWLVVWESQEPTQFYYASAIQAARVSPGGVVLDPDPIDVVTYPYSNGAMYSVASDGASWVVVAQGTSAGENDLVGVRIAADGTIADPAPKILVPAEYYLYFAIDLHFAGGEYLLTYDNLSDLRARRFTPDLMPLGTFTLPGLTLATNGAGYYLAWPSAGSMVGSPMSKTGILTFPAGIPIAPGSALNGIALGWDGTRWWFGANEYAAGITLRRIAANGTVIDAAGIPVDPPSALHADHLAVEGTPGGGGLALWEDTRAGGGIPHDVRLGHVSPAGTATAKGPVSKSAPAQLAADLTPGANGFLVAFQSRISGTNRIEFQRLSPQGSPIDPEPILLASGPHLGPPAAAWNGAVYFVVWSDGSNIFGRRVLPDGTVLDPTPIPVMGRFSPDVAAVGETFLVVGIDLLSNNPERQVPVARRVSGEGQVLDPQSRVLGSYFVRNPRVLGCGNRWLVAWQRHSTHDNPPASLDMAFVEADGTNHPELGFLTAGFTPDLAFSGQTILIAYRTGTDGVETKDIRGLRVLPDGSFPGGTGGFIISAAPDEQQNPAVTWEGAQFMVVWDDNRNAARFFDERTDLYGARVTEAGEVLDPGAFAVANDAVPEQLPALASGEDGRAILSASPFRSGPPFASYRVGIYVFGDATASVSMPGDAPAATFAWRVPNPLAPGMAMSYRLALPERVSLCIFSPAGALVATPLDAELQSAGEHRMAWDGHTTRGGKAARGVYFMRLAAGDRAEVRRIVLMR